MGDRELSVVSGVILDETITLSFEEVCHTCGLEAEELIAMVEEGLLEPYGATPHAWRFSAATLYRAQTAHRLQRDLHINLAGAALALELLDELRELRTRIRALER